MNYNCDKGVEQRNLLFDFYEPWVRKMTNSLFKRYYCAQLEWGDYYSQCSLGTLQAIEKYNLTIEIPFEGFAYKYLKGKLLDAIKSPSVSTCAVGSDSLHRERIDSGLESNDGSDLFESVVDAIVGMAFGQLIELGMLPDSACLQPKGNYNYLFESDSTTHLQVLSIVDNLPSEQRMVIKYHYFQQFKFSEIAEILGLTKARVSQIHKQALKDIRISFEKLY
ncbi:sigma-70 family RNA polymerase sigma factor [Catenovulum sediminis]|uniref:sigma-70 family RNA polymerase sigma factor n=1 Tax=Catenovulum sediminis TaxID=1740262 RepID=UPI00163DD419|nr:sigma-70 family RNA polymerase sigma factor [Catenovulum sediminis]